MFKIITLTFVTIVVSGHVLAAEVEPQKIIVELTPSKVEPSLSSEALGDLHDMILMASEILARNQAENHWLTSSVRKGQWSTFNYRDGRFGLRVFSESEKEALGDSIPKDLRTSDVFQVVEVHTDFIRLKSKEFELTIPSSRINFIARGTRGNLPN